jgi:hypothetical protein
LGRFFVRLALFTLVFLAVAEVWFRAVVPAAHLPYQVQDSQDMVLCLAPTPATTGHFSVGRLARQRSRWQVNEAGWNSTVAYRPAAERRKPCVAVIGNSFVEGFHTDVDSGIAATLARELRADYDVYNFGKSAVVASQMVHVAHYVERHFAPEVYVFVLNHGSLRESIRNFGGVAYNHQYRWENGSLADVPPEHYEPNILRFVRAHSALGRYVYNNAGGIRGFRMVRQETTQPTGALAAARSRQEGPALALAAHRIVADVRADHPDARILFVLDADRQSMYDLGARPESLRDSLLLEVECCEHGCGFLDLTDAFWTAYREDQLRFEYAGNYHWNNSGVTVVAQAIAGWLREATATATATVDLSSGSPGETGADHTSPNVRRISEKSNGGP